MTPSNGSRGALRFDGGGSGEPTLVLLHGLGANASVWGPLQGILRESWPHRWIAPDLRGHGRSGHGGPYGYGVHAADVAAVVGGQDGEAILLGHSMGGAVAMALATGWFGVNVKCVLAFGVKIAWTDGEVSRLKDLSARPVRWMDDRDEAVERYLKVSGLFGLVPPEDPLAAVGIAEENGRFRLAADNAINAVAGPELAAFYHAASCPVRLAAGERDPMCSLSDMRGLDPEAVVFEGLGHNCHVERPEAIWNLLGEMLKLPQEG